MNANLLLSSEDCVDLLEQLVGSVRSAVDDGVVFMEGDRHILLLEELGEVFPVVLLLLKLEAVVELIHLDLVWVVSGHNLCEDPTVAKVSLWVGDLVSQVERLDP